MDQSGSDIAYMGTDLLAPRDIIKLKRRAVRRYYRRLSYILKRLLKIRTFDEAVNYPRMGSAAADRFTRLRGYHRKTGVSCIKK